MFTAELLTIAKIQKQPKCPSIDNWIKKGWHIYSMECYLDIVKNKFIPIATTWMNLEDIMLSKISQRQTNTILFHLESEK